MKKIDKKRLIICCSVSLGLTFAGMLVNYLTGLYLGRPLLAQEYPGGEVIEYAGFGLIYSHFFPMYSAENPPAASIDYAFSFSLSSFLLTWLLLLIVTYLAAALLRKSSISKTSQAGDRQP